MHTRGSPFRLLVALLLATAVPFCCCNLHCWLSVYGQRHSVTPHASVEHAVHCHGKADITVNDADHQPEHHADHATGSTDSEHHPSPCRPGHNDHNDHNDCCCGKHTTLLTVAKTTLNLPAPVLEAILPLVVDIDAGVVTPFQTRVLAVSHLPAPAATLLRLHCALIV